MTDRETGRSRGFAFVEMENEGEADQAISALNGYTLDGRALNVNEARPKPERSFGGGGGGFGGGRGARGGGGGGRRPGGGCGMRREPRWRRPPDSAPPAFRECPQPATPPPAALFSACPGFQLSPAIPPAR